MYKFLAFLFGFFGICLMVVSIFAAGPIMDGVMREGGFLARVVFLGMLFGGGIVFMLVAGLILRTGQAMRVEFGLDSPWETYNHDIDGDLESEPPEEAEGDAPLQLGEGPKVE